MKGGRSTMNDKRQSHQTYVPSLLVNGPPLSKHQTLFPYLGVMVVQMTSSGMNDYTGRIN
jgi:hypothetical protein